MAETKAVKTGVGTLIKSKNTNRVLLICRKTRSFNGQFCLVGGKVKKNESMIEGLCREIIEEIGFMPEIVKITRLSEFMTEDKSFAFLSSLIVVENEFVPLLNDECSGYAWVDIRNLPKPLHPSLKDIIKDEILVSSIEKF